MRKCSFQNPQRISVAYNEELLSFMETRKLAQKIHRARLYHVKIFSSFGYFCETFEGICKIRAVFAHFLPLKKCSVVKLAKTLIISNRHTEYPRNNSRRLLCPHIIRRENSIEFLTAKALCKFLNSFLPLFRKMNIVINPRAYRKLIMARWMVKFFGDIAPLTVPQKKIPICLPVSLVIEFRERTYYFPFLAFFASIHRQGSSPVTFPGKCPVLNFAQPLTKTPFSKMFRIPMHFFVRKKQLLAQGTHFHPPPKARPIENGRIAPPAKRVFVRIRYLFP